MDIKRFVVSKRFQKIAFFVLGLAVVSFIFECGVIVGYHRSVFSAHFGDRYMREFDGGKPRGMVDVRSGELPGGHGAVGKVVKVTSPTFVVATPDNLEKIVRIDSTTLIREFRNTASSTDISLGDQVVVVGAPNDAGEIVARFIRIIPAVDQNATSTSTR